MFIPRYGHNRRQEHSYLLVNDGSGRFIDVPDAVGVALRGGPAGHCVQGAQGIDYDAATAGSRRSGWRSEVVRAAR